MPDPPAPVNTDFPEPSEAPGWSSTQSLWRQANLDAGGNANFFPLTSKAAHIIGVVHDLCESAEYLCHHPRAAITTYIPAYGVFASGVELLGRCLNGNRSTTGASSDLETGFSWLGGREILFISPHDVLLTTAQRSYTPRELAAYRHFAAHGQATSNLPTGHTALRVDLEILAALKSILATGLERYWYAVMKHETFARQLAIANVLVYKGWPLGKSWGLFSLDEQGVHRSITEIFQRFDFTVPDLR